MSIHGANVDDAASATFALHDFVHCLRQKERRAEVQPIDEIHMFDRSLFPRRPCRGGSAVDEPIDAAKRYESER